MTLDEARKQLEDARGSVAQRANELVDNISPHVTKNSGGDLVYLVDKVDVDELKELVQEWKKATEVFLAQVHKMA